MKVKRIVADIATSHPEAAARFYRDILGLQVLMDHGWIATYGSRERATTTRERALRFVAHHERLRGRPREFAADHERSR